MFADGEPAEIPTGSKMGHDQKDELVGSTPERLTPLLDREMFVVAQDHHSFQVVMWPVSALAPFGDELRGATRLQVSPQQRMFHVEGAGGEGRGLLWKHELFHVLPPRMPLLQSSFWPQWRMRAAQHMPALSLAQELQVEFRSTHLREIKFSMAILHQFSSRVMACRP